MRIASLRSLPLDVSVIGIAALGALCLLAWPVAILAAISFVGLPIFFIMAVVPTLALAVVAWRLSWIALARLGLRSVVASAILAALALALPPAISNARLEARVTALIRDDHADAGPLRGRTIALRDGLRARDAICGDLCRRLLLTGAADRVLVDPAGFRPEQAPGAATPATAFRLARTGGACPDATIEESGPTITMPAERADGRSAELMRMALVEGRCLLREPARLGDADIVVSEGRVADIGPGVAGLSLSDDVARARRLTLHTPGNGGLAERYRRTAVNAAPLLPILVPTYAEMHGLELKPGFLRSERRVNTWGTQLAPDWAAFFRERLGIDLGLAGLSGKAEQVATARAMLDRDGPLPGAAGAVAGDLFHAIILQGRMDAEQGETALALLRDPRLPVPDGAWVAVRHGAALRPGYVAEVGDVLFARLGRLAGPPSPEARALRNQGSALGSAIAILPDAEIRRHGDDLVRLAANGTLRVPAHAALRRLAALGPEGVPVLLSLVESAAALRAANPKEFEVWQHPYLSGIIGLCQMKAAGAAALPGLSAVLERRAVPTGGSYGRLAVNTLVSLGADPASVRATMAAAGLDAATVDKEIARAMRRIDCSY